MARADRIALSRVSGLLAVHTRINQSVEARLIVDTGAVRLVISRRVAGFLGLDLSSPLRWERLVGVGQSDPVPVVRLGRVEILACGADGLLASVYDLPPPIIADGLLGLSFLSRFRATFEFDTGTLVLRSPPPR